MTVEICTNKTELCQFLSQDPELHLYALGDLDDFFWPHSTYYVHRDRERISALVLVYQPGDLPVLMALGRKTDALNGLIAQLLPNLPQRIYAHISPGCERAFLEAYQQTYHETQVRMIRRKPSTQTTQPGHIVHLNETDAERLQAFYDLSYPANWFDDRMLTLHPFCGVTVNHQLVSVAGLHSYSETYRVAALGNITTHPDFRGAGYAQQCTEALCQQLEEAVDLIGLNVRGDNAAAIHTYKKTGFEPVYEFSEMMLERR